MGYWAWRARAIVLASLACAQVAVADDPSLTRRTILPESEPIFASHDGQMIERLEIRSRGTEPGIVIRGLRDVVVRDVLVHHTLGPGILADDADGLVIQNVRIVNDAAPPAGPHIGENATNRSNILIRSSDDVQIERVALERGSSGIYLLDSHRARLRKIEGSDFRGPFPRGQLVQFDKCRAPELDGFSVVNPGSTSWSEDGINAYGSTDPVIRNGYIEGVNSPSGIGVLIENGEGGSGGLVENVDVRFWANGAFMAAEASKGVTFRNIGAFDGLAPAAVSTSAGLPGADGQPLPTLEAWAGINYRGPPTSGQEAFLVFGASGRITFEDVRYLNPARAGRLFWSDVPEVAFEAKPTRTLLSGPLRLSFDWER